MNHMKTRLFASAGILLLGFSIAGCTPSETPSATSPATTPSTSTPETSDAPTDPVEPSTEVIEEPTYDVAVDTSQVPVLEAVGQFSAEDAQAALNASIAFTQQSLTTPDWYSGGWREQDWASLVEPYLGSLTEPMRNTMLSYNWEDVTQRSTIAAFFPVFEPTESLTVVEACVITWEACVKENIVFSQVGVVEEAGRLKVTYIASTNRNLLHNAEPAQSKVEYTVSHWMTKTPEGTWLIDATNNTTVFGQVSKAVQ